MSKSNKLKFEKVFKLTTFGLWITGFHPALPRGWLLRSCGTLSICVICFLLLCNSILNHRIPSADYDNMVRESIMTIVSFTLICKYTIVVGKRHIFLNIIHYINDDLESDNLTAAERRIISKYTNKGIIVSKFWLISVSMSGLLFASKALFSTLYYYLQGEVRYVQIFEVVYPSFLESHKNELLGYIGLCCLSLAFDVCAVFVYIGFEPLLSIFLLHFCGKLEILSVRMKGACTNTRDIDMVLDNIKSINVELKTIYMLVEDVQNTFVALFEFTMKTTTFLLPFTVLQIVQAFQQDVLNLEFVSLLTAVLLQFYMPSYYSNILMEKSEHMRQAIYSCGWEEHPNRRIRKMIIFMLTRTSKPVVLQTIFYTLDLETFAEMCRQAYAIYSIINAVWD